MSWRHRGLSCRPGETCAGQERVAGSAQGTVIGDREPCGEGTGDRAVRCAPPGGKRGQEGRSFLSRPRGAPFCPVWPLGRILPASVSPAPVGHFLLSERGDLILLEFGGGPLRGGVVGVRPLSLSRFPHLQGLVLGVYTKEKDDDVPQFTSAGENFDKLVSGKLRETLSMYVPPCRSGPCALAGR